MNGKKLIDETVKIAGLRNGAELAAKLGISRTTLTHWKSGRSLPDATQAARIAVLQGREPLAGIAAVEIERNRDNAAAVKFWRQELQKVREFIVCCMQKKRALARSVLLQFRDINAV